MFDQLCDDLAFVHPGILFATFFFGSVGMLYTFWSFTVSSITVCNSDCVDYLVIFSLWKITRTVYGCLHLWIHFMVIMQFICIMKLKVQTPVLSAINMAWLPLH